jgi:hypothetical protein
MCVAGCGFHTSTTFNIIVAMHLPIVFLHLWEVLCEQFLTISQSGSIRHLRNTLETKEDLFMFL